MTDGVSMIFQMFGTKPSMLAAFTAVLAGKRWPVNVLEIGSFMGHSAMTWAQAIAASGRSGTVVCVDPWKAYLTPGDTANDLCRLQNDLMAAGVVQAMFTAAVEKCPAGVRIVPIRSEFAAAAPLLACGAFDAVYIDGDHRYEQVRADIAAAIPLLRSDGVLCGDDLDIHPSDLWPVPDAHLATDTAWLANGKWYHAGVTKALGEAFPHDRIEASHGFWSVRDAATACLRV